MERKFETASKKEKIKMFAYGYEVTGRKKALRDVKINIVKHGAQINWNRFNTGDFYYDGNGEAFEVTVDHEEKTVVLN